VNTEPVREGVRVDLLGGFEDLARWLEAAGQLPPGTARTAATRWGGSAGGRRTLQEAKRFRAALRRGAERLEAGKPMGDDVVRSINRVLASRPAYPRLVRTGTRYVGRLEPVATGPLQLLVPVAESAAWLLEHGDASLVRRCEGTRCVLHFYDTTRNKSRRWCSMDQCGGRAKAAAYYRRTRARGAPG
ncbi:MAG: CGNR zinc finger domain-containing protein, partial [Gemmatimonadales bacterium]